MDEYIIESAPIKQWQMWLNQWKHKYDIEILSTAFDGAELLMVIKRTARSI